MTGLRGRLALVWLVVNLIGFTFAGALFHNFPSTRTTLLDGLWLGAFDLPAALFGALIGGVPTTLVGLGQWLVIKRQVVIKGWWVLSVPLGFAVMHFLADGFPYARDYTVFILLSGAAMGGVQALMMRSQVKQAGWWVLASSLGWTTGWLIGTSIVRASGLLNQPWTGEIGMLDHGISGAVTAVVYSLSTGLAFARLTQN